MQALAALRLKQNRLEEGAALTEQLAREMPELADDPKMLDQLGTVYDMLGKTWQAAECFRRGLRALDVRLEKGKPGREEKEDRAMLMYGLGICLTRGDGSDRASAVATLS